METSKVFLLKIRTKIENGEYKDRFNLPFMSEEKLYNAIEKKVKHREKTGATAIVSDAEIDEMIKDMYETSGSIFHLFLKYGFLEEVENGYEISDKGKMALKQAILLP